LLTTFEYYRAPEDSFDTMVYLISIVFKHTKMFNDPDLDSKTVTDYYHAEREKRLLKAKEEDEQFIFPVELFHYQKQIDQ